MKKALSIVLSTMLLLALLVIPAQAAEEVTLNLPVTQTVTLEGEGAKAEDAVVDYTLTAVTPDAPMPEGAGEGTYSFQLIGDENYQIPTITYSSTGIWQYRLNADGEGVSPKLIDISVYVTRENGVLTCTVVAELANGEKCDLTFNVTVKADEPGPGPEPEPIKYTVSFEIIGGPEIDDQIVEEGGTAVRPSDPIREGYTFDGWYLDEDCTIPYDFSTPVTGNITLYAKWIENEEPEPTPPGPPEPPGPPTPPTPPSTGEFEAWSLVNLICALLTAGVCAVMMMTMHRNGRKLLGILPAAATGAIFLMTEHMSLPMQLCDKYTPLMLGLLAVNVMLAYLTSGKTAEDRAD